MKRSDFFRSLAAIAVTPSVLKAGTIESETQDSSLPTTQAELPTEEILRRQISSWAGGIPVDRVVLLPVARHDRFCKYDMIVEAGQHTVRKAVVVSGLAMKLTRNEMDDLAYTITLRAREAARDLASLWWGPDKWRAHAI